MTRLLAKADLNKSVKMAKDNGCQVVKTPDTVTVFDGAVKVIQSLKHPAGHWITTYKNSERISWTSKGNPTSSNSGPQEPSETD